MINFYYWSNIGWSNIGLAVRNKLEVVGGSLRGFRK